MILLETLYSDGIEMPKDLNIKGLAKNLTIPSNINSLVEKGEIELAIKVCNELLAFDANNKRLLKVISNAYISAFEDAKAVQSPWQDGDRHLLP